MRRLLRFVAWIAVAIVAVVFISAVVAVASVELACRPDAADAADTPAPIVEDAGYRRDILGDDMRGFKGVEPDVYIEQPRLGKPHVLELGERRFEIVEISAS